MNKEKLMKYLPLIAIVILMLVGGFFRVNEALHSDVWYDEAFTGITVRQSWKDFFAVIIQDRNHPPLYYSLVKIVTGLTGSTDPFHIRIVSLVFGIATIPLGYAFVQQLSLAEREKKWLGLSVSTLFALSPFYITYSAEARSYAFLLFLMLLSMIFFIRAAKKSFKFSADLVWWALTIVLIFATHYLSTLIVSGFVVAFILLKLEENKTLYDIEKMKGIGLATILGWIGITWLWNHFSLSRFVERLNLGWIPQADLSLIPRTIMAFLFGVNRQQGGVPSVNSFSFPLLAGNLGFVILIASVIALVLVVQKNIKDRTKMKEILLLGSLGIVPLVCDLLASSFGLHMYVDRYVIGYGTALLLFFMYLWWDLLQDDFVGIMAVYIVLLFFVVRPVYPTRYTQVMNDLPQNNSLVIESPIDFLVFKYYMPDRNILVLKDLSGNSYNWPYIPPTVEVEQSKVKIGSNAVMSKWTSRAIPANWKKNFETSEFTGYVVN